MTLPSPIRPRQAWSLRDEIDPLPLSIGALLVVTLVVQLARPAPAPVDHALRTESQLAPTPISTAAPDYPQILSRSLFTPGRGLAGGAGADQTASATLSDYTLVGVASVGGRGVAVLRGPSGNSVSLHAGESLLGWQVAAIGQGGVVLQQGDVRRQVAVSSPAAPKTGAQ